jgi:hypothetical protein
MIGTRLTTRLGVLGAVVSIAILAAADRTAATPPAAEQSAVVTGAHANEDFCKTMIKQMELLGLYAKLDPSTPDMTMRAKYFADQKALNAALLRTAPASLAGDVAVQTRNANASLDAQLTRDPARIKAAVVPLRSPEHLTASRHMNDYCGVKLATSK